jgi:hypothetical protein
LGLEKPNSGPDPGETFFPNSVSDLGSAETFTKSRNVGPVMDENVCLLDSQPWTPYPHPPTPLITYRLLKYLNLERNQMDSSCEKLSIKTLTI